MLQKHRRFIDIVLLDTVCLIAIIPLILARPGFAREELSLFLYIISFAVSPFLGYILLRRTFTLKITVIGIVLTLISLVGSLIIVGLLTNSYLFFVVSVVSSTISLDIYHGASPLTIAIKLFSLLGVTIGIPFLIILHTMLFISYNFLKKLSF